ncbi:hypothetical protein PsAD2_03444 [Pseudovibrio axinellae]|uniref:DUF998 domain-containing protein n=1 Tax=Pseudovibrio axinellae TaxID=989403 RepID=A0A161VB54_9HYPH|nr:DUF998 domain-containing protein [Pseudovibrio axinellae]KZL16570.1 hypothetical protein PsAD2_03444 [Pseudovibrio axinellae]SEQ15324.1 Protein of unknown function [Pseudovibrio axinellae]
MSKTGIAISFAALSYLWLVAAVAIGGATYPDYSHSSQFMSELGAIGAPFGAAVNLWGFAMAELLLLPCLVICFFHLMRRRAECFGLLVFAGYPILIAVAAFFPCDFECSTADPTQSQLIHMAAGFLAYFCAVVGLSILSGAVYERPFWIVPCLILMAMLFNLSIETTFNGLMQRVLETGIYLWFFVILMGKRYHKKQVA